MQRLNDGGSIALLSSATNLYQLLTFATTLDQIVNKDEDTCQQLENEHAELEQQRAELEQAKADLEATQADLETQRPRWTARRMSLPRISPRPTPTFPQRMPRSRPTRRP